MAGSDCDGNHSNKEEVISSGAVTFPNQCIDMESVVLLAIISHISYIN